MKEISKTLVLLDAHAIIHRAYHALPDFLSSSGEPTGALYGLSTMLMKIITDLKPDYMIACYDLPQKTFRHEAYEGYKAGRKKAEEDLVIQIKNSRQIFDAFGIPIYDSPGFEADDILGTIVEKLKKKNNLKIIIASGDMDTMQLVDDEKVRVYTLKKGMNDTILYDEKKVVERFGFSPTLLPDYKGLRGDPSDNIVGIKGIGEKTATGLISEFGTIEEIYKHLKDGNLEDFKKIGLTDRVINLLKENEEEAEFSKTLAKIRTDAPINFKMPEKTFWQNADLGKIENIFSNFEFRSLFARLKNFFENTGRINPKGLRVGLAGVGDPENRGPEQTLLDLDGPDEKTLQETSIALWLLNSDISDPSLEDILFFARTKSFEKAREYIFKQLREKNLDKVFEEIEKPIIPLVKEMQDYGVLVDKRYFKDLSSQYQIELDKLTKEIYKMAGTEFNINSPKQLSSILFEKMGMRSPQKRSKRLPAGRQGSFSTKVSVLEELEGDNPIIKKILSYRELQKLLSTYINVIPKMVEEDGRLHAKFLQDGTTTGRFSSQEPNLQNLPIKTELGKKIRNGFVADKGSKLLACDYSQIELRVAAILSGDKKMTKIFKEGKDIHAGVASFVFGVPMDSVDAEMRRQAKVINFGIMYGMGVSSLRKSLVRPKSNSDTRSEEITRAEAQKFYDNYFKQFSGLHDYLEKVKVFAAKNLYTETLFGRRRYFPNINSRIPYIQNMALRTAINAPIQGTATADIIKLAIRYVREDLEKAGLSQYAHLVLQIHDELVYEIKEDKLEQAEEIIKNAMQTVLERSYLHLKTDVPILVHSGSGYNLGEVK